MWQQQQAAAYYGAGAYVDYNGALISTAQPDDDSGTDEEDLREYVQVGWLSTTTNEMNMHWMATV
jgi:hypothetical protein